MKLRYLTSARLPTEKAHGIQIVSMCQAFAAAGAEVELVIPRRYTQKKSETELFAYYTIPPTFSLRTLPILNLTPLAPLLGKIPYALLYRSFAKNAHKDAQKNTADIYYIRDDQTFIRLAESGLPTVYETHTVPNRAERFKEAFERCIAIICITQNLRNELIAVGAPAHKLFVAPDAVDLTRFSSNKTKEDARKILGIDQKKQIVVYTGQLFKWKGVDTLVEASVHLKENQEVIIVGGGAGYETELKEKAKKIKARVRFEGQQPHTKIPDYLQAADYVIIPTSGKERLGSHHTSPLKLFEAMAMGKAIIASNLPSLREILDETCALFFTADNPESLAQVFSSALHDKQRAAKLGATAHDRAQSYTWEKRANDILAFIRRLDRTL